MKKLICVLSLLSALLTCVFANDEKVRLDFVAADTLSSNIYTTTNTTNLGLRVGLNNNKVGILAGGMIREAFATAELPSIPTDFYWSANPYLGVELWNVEILGGVVIGKDFECSPYASLCYNLDLIKPNEVSNSRLSLKMGLEYYFDQFVGKYGPESNSDSAVVAGLGIDLFSVFIPKASIGLQYSIGKGF